jgi:hypothetical protein
MPVYSNHNSAILQKGKRVRETEVAVDLFGGFPGTWVFHILLKTTNKTKGIKIKKSSGKTEDFKLEPIFINSLK